MRFKRKKTVVSSPRFWRSLYRMPWMGTLRWQTSW